MPYKAIIFDLDGTAIPNRKDGKPSQYLIDTIQKIKDQVHISVATGRRIFDCRDIFASLKLTSPSIILGGTQIVDPVSEKILWEKLIPRKTVDEIINVAKNYQYKVILSNEKKSSPAIEKTLNGDENIVYIMDIDKEGAITLLNDLDEISGISSHLVPAYNKGNFDIHITNREATKKHALEELFKMMDLKKQDVIGFGDGENDLPIFEAVGYRVAMDSGSEKLKNFADLIAKSPEEDGVAQVLVRLFSKSLF